MIEHTGTLYGKPRAWSNMDEPERQALFKRQDIFRDLKTPVIERFSWVPCAPIEYWGIEGPFEAQIGIVRGKTELKPPTLAALKTQLGAPIIIERAHRAPGTPARGWWWYAVDGEGRPFGFYMMINASTGAVMGARHPVRPEQRSPIPGGNAATFAYVARLHLEATLGK